MRSYQTVIVPTLQILVLLVLSIYLYSDVVPFQRGSRCPWQKPKFARDELNRAVARVGAGALIPVPSETERILDNT